MTTRIPSIVIVGRPNVGKSTLFNRITGTRRSIVTDEPGITRDRIYGDASWEGRAFEVVDTGGIVPDDEAGIPGEILRQARKAIENATRVVLVVDARTGPNPIDLELAALLRRAGKPPVIAANKVDSMQHVSLAAPFYELGNEVFPISADHGFGVDELLDSLTADFKTGPAPEAPPEINVAIIGRPNVGKSTLLNRLAGTDRVIVSAEPGTTRDAIDTLVEHGGKMFRFLDTAGIRRKGKTRMLAEKLSVLMARRHLERADVAVLVIDGSMGFTSHDVTIADYARQSGCALIIVVNKWDLALDAWRKKNPAESRRDAAAAQLHKEYEKIIRAKLRGLDYALVIFLSALTGERTRSLFALIQEAAAARVTRVSTGELNRWLNHVDLERGSSPAAQHVKIYYITQSGVAPPTFVLFTNQTRPLHFSYQRFLDNQLRETFPFRGSPIRFSLRLKPKRSRQERLAEEHAHARDKKFTRGRPPRGGKG
jgi:GTP-binding protein